MRKSRTEYCAGLIALLVGLGYVFLMPPFQAPDETSHFLKAWSVSQGKFLPTPTADHRLGDTLPVSLYTLCQFFRPNNKRGDTAQDWSSIRQGMQLPLHPEDRHFVDFANTGIYGPLAYLPAALVIRISSHLGCPPLLSLYLARLVHLGLWLWCLFVIWQSAGAFRWLFLYLGLLPGVLVFQSCLNPDAVIHAASWILILQLLIQLPGKRWKLGGPLLILISWQKLILFPLGWVNPLHRDRRVMYIWALFAISVAAIWGLVAARSFITYDDYHLEYRDGQTLNPGVDPSDQLDYIIHHPLQFGQAAITGVVRSLPATTAHILGKYGWEKHYLPPALLVLLFFGLLLICCQTPGPPRITSRFQLLGICACVFVLFSITNYLLWDSVGAEVQDNFQGRYFIPVLPLIGLAVSKSLISSVSMRKWAFLFLLAGHVFLIFLLLKSLFF